MKVDPKPSRRFSEYVRKISCDEWTSLGKGRDDVGVLQHESGVTVAYGLHDGGNDINGPRNFAAEVQRICGCHLIEARGRKRSRKADQTSGFSIAGTRPSATGDTVLALQLAHEHQRERWQKLIQSPTAVNAAEARALLPKIRHVENALRAFHQPVEEIGT